MRAPLLVWMAVLGLTSACERAVLSVADDTGRLSAPTRHAPAKWLGGPGYAAMGVTVMKGFDSLFGSFSGVVCLTMASSSSHAHECVLSSHGVLLGLDGKPPFSQIVLPVADHSAPLDVTVVVKRVPTATSDEVLRGLKLAVSGLALTPMSGDGVTVIKAVLDGLAPRELPAYSHAVQLWPSAGCVEANCAAPLFDGARYVLTFARESAESLRQRTRLVHGELVDAHANAVDFPAVVLTVRAARFTALALPPACRASIDAAQLGDGSEVDVSCAKGSLLPADVRAAAMATSAIDGLRVRGLRGEALAHRVVDARRAATTVSSLWPTGELLRPTLDRLVADAEEKEVNVGALAEVLETVPQQLSQLATEARQSTGCELAQSHRKRLDDSRATVARQVANCTVRGCEIATLASAFEAAEGALESESTRCFLSRFDTLTRANPTALLGAFDPHGVAHFDVDPQNPPPAERWEKATAIFDTLELPRGANVARMVRGWRAEQRLQALVSIGLSDHGALFAAMVDLVLERARTETALLPRPVAQHYEADIERLKAVTAARLYMMKEGRLVPRQLSKETLTELKALQLALDADTLRVGIPQTPAL